MAMPYYRISFPGIHEIHHFGRGFRSHYYPIFSLFAWELLVEKIFKEIMNFYFMTKMASP